MIYTVCIGHMSQMRNWGSERQGKTKKKSKQPRSHTKEIALYQFKSSYIRNFKPHLYGILSQDVLYAISMRKIITKKFMNKDTVLVLIGIPWSLKQILFYYIIFSCQFYSHSRFTD